MSNVWVSAGYGNLSGLPTSCVKHEKSEIHLQSVLDLQKFGKQRYDKGINVKNHKVESEDNVEPSNIESQPCTSKSNIQYAASEIASLQDINFGMLEESGLGKFTLVIREETSGADAADEKEGETTELETQTSASSADDTTMTSSTVLENDDDSVVESDATQHSRDKPIVSLSGGVRHHSTVSKKREKVSGVNLQLDQTTKKFENAIDRLEKISNKFVAASLVDKYDQFGKYISTLLRGLPPKKLNSVKKKLIADVFDALQEIEDKELFKVVGVNNKTQVNRPTDVSSEPRALPKKKNNVPAETIPVGSNVPVIGGNMPFILPGPSSSASYQLLPLIPMGTSPTPSVAPVATTASLVGPVVSVQPIPSCETITTVAKSVSGTLLAINIPKPLVSND